MSVARSDPRVRGAQQRFVLVISSLIVLLLATGIVSLGIGAVTLPPYDVVAALWEPHKAEPTSTIIVWDLRLARVLLAALIGAGLASAGTAFQGLFRNPLADPFVVGASSGAALGATLAIVFDVPWRGLGLSPVPLMAFVGALLAVVLVYTVAEIGGQTPLAALLLAGAALSTMLSAIVSLLLLLNDQPLYEVFAWLLGGLSGRSWPQLAGSAPYILLSCGLIMLLARPLDALACGEETAQTLGLSLLRVRGATVAAASIATAASVATGGTIGFVGLIAPHIARLLVGGSHTRLIPASALCGAILLLLADTIARWAFAPIELPVGIVTALLGGPFFLYLLKTRSRVGM